MNKRIRQIITIGLTTICINGLYVFNIFSDSVMASKVYASETESVYLKNISLNKSDIDFDQDTFYYDVKVDKDTDEIKITLKPKSEDVAISINDDFIDKDENNVYKKVMGLEKGNNTVRIKVTNDEDYKIYTLNILRGEVEQDDVYLSNINLDTGNINFSKNIDSYDIDVKESVNKITIGAIPESDMYEVIVDGGIANKGNNYKQTVDLNKGKNPITIKVKDNKHDKQRTYILNIRREDSLDNKDAQDDIYLNYIKVDDKRIDVDENTTTYNINLDEDTSQVDITAEPAKSEYKVKINDKITEDVDNYKDTVDLKQGSNKVIIKIQDEPNNKQRIYTLNINVGKVEKDTTSVNTKYNQWVFDNNGWKYNDSTGNLLKNTWFYDKNTGKNYYLQADGTMATGWLLNSGKWYYLDSNGGMQRGWINTSGNWYYLNSEGIMQVGWVKDADGRYYYLQDNGAMVKNTQIGGYSLGKDGAWIK